MRLRELAVCILAIGTVQPVFSQKSADFIILSQPRTLAIFDEYQQPLSDEEKKLFSANVPARIENDNELLGDQITHALRFGFDGKTWFVQKDESGNFAGETGKQVHQTFRRCDLANDTVTVLEEHGVSFSEKGPSVRGGGFLAKGETVTRIFSYNGAFFVKRGSPDASFGWSIAARPSAWKKVEGTVLEQADNSNYISGMIARHFAEVNNTYKEYFDHFNAFTGKDKTVPAWHCEVTGDQLRCVLNLPYKETHELDESTESLVHDIDNLLIGKGYDVIANQGEILVRPKTVGAGKR